MTKRQREIMNKITPGVKSAVNAYLLARAHAEVMREKVNDIYRDILTETPMYADRYVKANSKPRRILETKDMYLCSDDDFCQEVYYEGNLRLRKAGIKPDDMPDDHCPALVAEHIQTETEWLIVDNAAEMLGEDDDFRDRLLCAGMDKYHQFIDLVVKLVVNLPGFKSPLS